MRGSLGGLEVWLALRLSGSQLPGGALSAAPQEAPCSRGGWRWLVPSGSQREAPPSGPGQLLPKKALLLPG